MIKDSFEDIFFQDIEINIGDNSFPDSTITVEQTEDGFKRKITLIGETYNIGGGNEISNINLTKSILELMGQGIDCLSYVEDRVGHDFRYSVNSSKVHSKIGFKPRISFSKGLSDTSKWYEDNQSWWKPLK